jgi:hypothetical protein
MKHEGHYAVNFLIFLARIRCMGSLRVNENSLMKPKDDAGVLAVLLTLFLTLPSLFCYRQFSTRPLRKEMVTDGKAG